MTLLARCFCLAILLLVAPASAQPVVNSGKKWIKLVGREGCVSSSGWLGTEFCKKNDSALLWSTGGGVRTTWIMKAASGNPKELLGVPSTFSVVTRNEHCRARSFLSARDACLNVSVSAASRNPSRGSSMWVLEKAKPVPGQPAKHGQFYIRAHSRSGCQRRYLGAVAPKSPAPNCGDPELRLYRKGEKNTLIVWSVIPRKEPPPPRPPHPSPRPPRPPPSPQLVRPPPPSPKKRPPQPPPPTKPPPTPRPHRPPPPNPHPSHPPPSPRPPPPSPSPQPPPPSPSPHPPPNPPPPSPSSSCCADMGCLEPSIGPRVCASLPDPPSQVDVATLPNESVEVAFSLPTFTGGPDIPITSVLVVGQPENPALPAMVANGLGTPRVNSSLFTFTFNKSSYTCGQEYYFFAWAENALGQSETYKAYGCPSSFLISGCPSPPPPSPPPPSPPPPSPPPPSPPPPSPPPPSPPPTCAAKSDECSTCPTRRRSLLACRRRSLAGLPNECCSGLQCAYKADSSGEVCSGPPSEPTIAHVEYSAVCGGEYNITVRLDPSQDPGATGMDISSYNVTGIEANSHFLPRYESGLPPNLTYIFTNVPCGMTVQFTATATNNAGLTSDASGSVVEYLPSCSSCQALIASCCADTDCCSSFCNSGACNDICFPASATVRAANGRTLTMAQLRSGDRVLAVGWDGKPRYEEVYFWNHRNPGGSGRFATVTVAEPGPITAGGSATTRRLQLSYTHYMAAGHDTSGACAALAAAAASGSESEEKAQAVWTLAAQELRWERDHVMTLPPSLESGMVAWTLGHNNTAATPACILSVEARHEAGGFSPFVRARGIVVDGVVASSHTKWGPVLGRNALPAAADSLVPGVMEAALLPVYWLYRLLGPKLAFRLNNHPLFLDGPKACFVVGNIVVWGQLAVLVALAAGTTRLLAQRKRGAKNGGAGKHKTE